MYRIILCRPEVCSGPWSSVEEWVPLSLILRHRGGVLGTRGSARRIGSLQIFHHVVTKAVLDLFDWLARIDGHETELRCQAPVLFNQVSLIALERIEQISAQGEVHAGFPVVHPFAVNHSWDQGFDVYIEIQYQVGHQCHAKDVAGPRFVRTHYRVTRKRRVHIAIGDNDEPSLQGGQNFMFQAIGKISRIQEAESGDRELMPGFGLVNGRRKKRRTSPSRIADLVTFKLEPRAQQIYLG